MKTPEPANHSFLNQKLKDGAVVPDVEPLTPFERLGQIGDAPAHCYVTYAPSLRANTILYAPPISEGSL